MAVVNPIIKNVFMINHVTPISDIMIFCFIMILEIRQVTKRCIYLLLVYVCSLIIYILSISLKLLLLLCNLKCYFEHINYLNTFVGIILKIQQLYKGIDLILYRLR